MNMSPLSYHQHTLVDHSLLTSLTLFRSHEQRLFMDHSQHTHSHCASRTSAF